MSDRVHAFAIENKHIHVKCKKCGMHRYGSNGDYKSNRVEDRNSHCPFNPGNENIVIDDDTLRCDVSSITGKPLKRSFKYYLK